MKRSCTRDLLRDALLNDSEIEISSSVIDALINYEVQPISLSQRDKVCEELAA